MEQLIADLIQARETGAAIIMVKQFTQALTRLQPIMGLQFAAERNHAAYDGAQCGSGIDFIKTQGGKLLIHLQLLTTCHASVSKPMLRA
jgi:hypothetical protein